LKDHHLIALLQGRDAETLTEWLKSHQKIRLVARDRASTYATVINAVLPDCVQVADPFHLLQNLLGYLKDIFKAEMPSCLYIKDGKILDQESDKIWKEKEPDKKYLATLHYDNTLPMNPDGPEQLYDNKNHCLSRKQYKEQAENRKKKWELVLEVQQFWETFEKKKITTVAEYFKISNPMAKRYINMSVSETEGMDPPKNYKKRESPMNKWLNVIFKMMLDGHSNETIYFYIRERKDFTESMEQLGRYIYLIGKNNFLGRIPFNARYLMENVMPPDVLCFKRMEILKYLLTCSPKV